MRGFVSFLPELLQTWACVCEAKVTLCYKTQRGSGQPFALSRQPCSGAGSVTMLGWENQSPQGFVPGRERNYGLGLNPLEHVRGNRTESPLEEVLKSARGFKLLLFVFVVCKRNGFGV